MKKSLQFIKSGTEEKSTNNTFSKGCNFPSIFFEDDERTSDFIQHKNNTIIKGWRDIAPYLGFYNQDPKIPSNVKRAQSFVNNIPLPIIIKDGNRVYSNKDILCSVRYFYVFGRQDISTFLNISYSQFNRWKSKYKKLRELIRRFDGSMEYADKRELKLWLFEKEFFKCKNNPGFLKRKKKYIDSHPEIMKNVALPNDLCRYFKTGEAYCPICNEPTEYYYTKSYYKRQ